MTDVIDTLPPVLRGLCRGAIADLPDEEADQFPARLSAALEGSTADLERVGWRVMHRILERLPVRPPEALSVIEGIGKLAEGGQWPAERAALVSEVAWAAAWVAEEASLRDVWSSACAAAYAAQAVARESGYSAIWVTRSPRPYADASCWARSVADTASGVAYYAEPGVGQEAEARNIIADILKGLRDD